jgi:hypothetical protein
VAEALSRAISDADCGLNSGIRHRHDGFFKKKEQQVNRALFGYEIDYGDGIKYRDGKVYAVYAVSLKDLGGNVLWTDEEEERDDREIELEAYLLHGADC